MLRRRGKGYHTRQGPRGNYKSKTQTNCDHPSQSPLWTPALPFPHLSVSLTVPLCEMSTTTTRVPGGNSRRRTGMSGTFDLLPRISKGYSNAIDNPTCDRDLRTTVHQIVFTVERLPLKSMSTRRSTSHN